MKISWLHSKSGSSNLLADRTYSVVAVRTFVLAFASNVSKQFQGDLRDCYQYFLWCSGECAFQKYIWESEENSAQLIQYPTHSYKTRLENLENYVWIFWIFQKYMWESEENRAQLIQYPNHNYKTRLENLENYVWIFTPVSDLDQAAVLW